MGVLSPQSVGGTSTVLNLYVEDVDTLWERAVGAGAEMLQPLGEAFWGDRHGQHRPIRPPLGCRARTGRHPARGDCSRRSQGVRRLSLSRAFQHFS